MPKGPSTLDRLERFHAKSRPGWRAWLEAHHRSSEGVWLVTYKKGTGKPRIDYEEAVEELLCFGWVDSLPRSLDDESSMLLCTPRKAKSAWSKHNKARIERLRTQGKLAPRGLEVVAEAQRSGRWDALDEVEALRIPSDLAERLSAYRGAKDNFESFPPSVRRGILEWIVQAKRPTTRAHRVEETASLAAKNIRANQWPRTKDG